MARKAVGVKRTPSGRWEGRAMVPDGAGGKKEKAKTFDTKTEAVEWRERQRVDVGRGRYVDPDAGKVTVEEYAVPWLANKAIAETSREQMESRFRCHVFPHLGKLQLAQVKPSGLQAWLRGIENSLAPGTVKVIFANVSEMLNAAVDDGLILTNPAAKTSVRPKRGPKKEIEIWTPDEVRRVIEAMPEPYAAIAAVAAGCGLRQGEAFGLRRQDIHFLARRIDVVQQVKLERGKLRTDVPKHHSVRRDIPLPDFAATLLAQRIERHTREDEELVFLTRERKMLNRNYFNPKIWKPAVIRAGIDEHRRFSFHTLRHFFASATLEEGISPATVAKYLGHADPGYTLRVYGHLMPASEDRTRSTMDAVLRGSSEGHGLGRRRTPGLGGPQAL